MANSSEHRLGWNTLLGFVVLLVGAALVLLLIRAVWNLLTSASPQVASSVVVASATVLASVLTLVYSRRQEQRRELEQKQRERKTVIYEELLTFWFRVLTDESEDGAAEDENGSSIPDEEIQEYVTGFTHKLVTWGSEDVLKEYALFKESMKNGGAMLDFEKVLFAVRADLGYSNKDLQTGDLLRVFLSGVDDLLRERDEGSSA